MHVECRALYHLHMLSQYCAPTPAHCLSTALAHLCMLSASDLPHTHTLTPAQTSSPHVHVFCAPILSIYVQISAVL
eukprot:1941279-Rhodomonas_salina.1